MKVSGKKLSPEERKLILMIRKAFRKLTKALDTVERVKRSGKEHKATR